LIKAESLKGKRPSGSRIGALQGLTEFATPCKLEIWITTQQADVSPAIDKDSPRC
jgi:hypothetical protein